MSRTDNYCKTAVTLIAEVCFDINNVIKKPVNLFLH